MPFLWKRVKSTRISQLVNDHLHISQKRRDGSSLVVETGFPTSLIDLFIKNREKMKKKPKKKRRNSPISPSDGFPATVGSPFRCPSPPPPSLVGSPPPEMHPSTPLPPPAASVDEISVAVDVPRAAVVEECAAGGGECGGGVEVFVWILKVFVVVALVLVTKRFAVAITISTALLIFLEFVGKHCSAVSPPFTAAVDTIIRRGGRLLCYKKLDQKQDHVPTSITVESRFDSTSGVHEIQPEEETSIRPISRNSLRHQEMELLDMAMKREETIRDATDSHRKSRAVEWNDESSFHSTARVDEIQLEKETSIRPNSRNRLRHQEMELLEMAMKREENIGDAADSHKKSRKAKIKFKMQKMFRRSRKGQESHLEQVEQYDIDDESENGSTSSSTDRRLSDVNDEVDRKMEDKGLGRRYMPLCVIVLVGLIGGRPFALLLTLSWLLLLKLVPRKIKLCMINC